MTDQGRLGDEALFHEVYERIKEVWYPAKGIQMETRDDEIFQKDLLDIVSVFLKSNWLKDKIQDEKLTMIEEIMTAVDSNLPRTPKTEAITKSESVAGIKWYDERGRELFEAVYVDGGPKKYAFALGKGMGGSMMVAVGDTFTYDSNTIEIVNWGTKYSGPYLVIGID